MNAPRTPFPLAAASDDALRTALGDARGFAPLGGPLDPGLSRWDAVQYPGELAWNQSDCNWFAFEARDDGARRFAGILALHRTGPRLAGLDGGSDAEAMPASARALLSRFPGSWLPLRPRFDPRPLFVSVLYDLAPGAGPARCFERPVEGDFDAGTFSFAGRDGDQALVQGRARELAAALPPALRAGFDYDGPAIGVRTRTDDFELELFLRPHKNPVAYGPGGAPRLTAGPVEIQYVQRTRLDVVGLLRARGPGGDLGAPAVLRGSATQDRHWMTTTDPDVRWIWVMARLADGTEVMAFELRTADGGRHAPADAGRRIDGGAWVVLRDGRARRAERFTLRPERHVDTGLGRVPTRFRLTLPDEGVDLHVEHLRRSFVPTRALGELLVAGIWESPADRVGATSAAGDECFWVDVMPPFGAS